MMTDETKKRGGPRANDVVWPWRAVAMPEVRPWRRALLQALVALVVAAILYFYEKQVVACVALVVAVVLCFCGLVLPAVYRKIDQFGQWLGHWVGLLLTWILLTPFYFVLLWPCSLFLKTTYSANFKQDAPAEDSYWHKRKSIPSKEQYLRQF